MNAKTRRAIFWYTPETYKRMQAVAADPESFNPPFGKWRISIERRIDTYAETVEFVRVDVDIDDFLLWCEETGNVADAAGRKAYAGQKAGTVDCH